MRSQLRLTSPQAAWFGVALTFYSFIAIGLAEGGLGVLLPSILATYRLTPGTVTFLFLSQVSGYTIAAITSSLLTSRLGLAKTGLLAATLLTSALSIYAASTHWVIMVAAGSLSGFGAGLIDAGGNTYIANDQRNAHLMGMLHAFYGMGALLGPTLATTLLAMKFEWRQVYSVVAVIVGMTIVGMMWAVIHRYAPMQRSTNATTSPATSNLRSALRSPIVLLSGLLLLVYVGLEVSIGNWAYTVQTVSRGLPHELAGFSLTGYWMGLTIGRLGMGYLMRWMGPKRLIAGSLLALMVGLLVWWLMPQAWGVLPVLGLVLSTIFPATMWLTPQRIDRGIVPAAIGFMASVASLGAAVVPTLIGWISDRFGLDKIPVALVPLAVLLMGVNHWLEQRPAIEVIDSVER